MNGESTCTRMDKPHSQLQGFLMTKDSPTYEELKARHDKLQKEAARSLIISQELITAKDQLDRDLARFMAIQSYGEKAIHVGDREEFYQLSVESIIEAFEVECSALLRYDKEGTAFDLESFYD